ncbi:PAP associated domain containing 5 isoform a [Thecamonas trahens ATCC 50062]|uniref:PAP associated domain containing 5 isoform a n=1 Tax=Thecamonas trahens ATCC 50062 TaxID=461836 RepID=A0A0L0D9X2_THETB|nr:PAP associated domain containing 5 isoform a [Thecamonas trahens ATCC 50062]KNC48068.1 PAP associated domain containing 5 isoform a [Thecamonas trahens ATCC 50062]|eukprot:XP_013759083.1 PAP associated domain containing 5 isoform a [Thecamonas trahens ATCC 50062]
MRAKIIGRITEVVVGLWPEARVLVCGSVATGLYLFDSDIDLVVLGTDMTLGPVRLEMLKEALVQDEITTDDEVQVRGASRIPLLQFVEAYSRLTVDICFDVLGAVENVSFVRQSLYAIPELKALYFVLKTFLKQSNLNQVFSGGLSSHALILMLISFEQLRPMAASDAATLSGMVLGARLTQFLQYYSLDFDYTQAISVLQGGYLFPKSIRRWLDPSRPELISIEDPSASNDICRQSYKYPMVRSYFAEVGQTLLKFVYEGASEPVPSLLSTMIFPGPYAVFHKQRLESVAGWAAGRKSYAKYSAQLHVGGGRRGVRGGRGAVRASARPRAAEQPDPDLSLDSADIHTVMMRNIPNKHSAASLLEVINKSFKGTYDFFYLPIDFKNKCNLGYAFINFIESQTVAAFAKAFDGVKWSSFNSFKVCAISPARIQGKAALIAHFQNSSLMYREKACRPLIFVSSGPRRGEPLPFPFNTGAAGPPGPGEWNSSQSCGPEARDSSASASGPSGPSTSTHPSPASHSAADSAPGSGPPRDICADSEP